MRQSGDGEGVGVVGEKRVDRTEGYQRLCFILRNGQIKLPWLINPVHRTLRKALQRGICRISRNHQF